MTVKGYKQTLETRYNMGLGQRKRFSNPEEREKLSKACVGRVISPETKAKMKASQKIYHDSPKYKLERSRMMKGRVMSLEWRMKISKALKGRKCTPETIAKMSVAARIAQKGKVLTPEHKAKISAAHRRLCKSPEYQTMIKASLKKAWQDMPQDKRDKRVRKIMLRMHIHPNKPELCLLKLLNDAFPKEWKYVGDGQFILGGKNPDFVNKNGKKQIIELFGNYWHSEKITERTEKDEVKYIRRVYSRYGYKTLVIWQSELRNQNKVMTKIAKFTSTEVNKV